MKLILVSLFVFIGADSFSQSTVKAGTAPTSSISSVTGSELRNSKQIIVTGNEFLGEAGETAGGKVVVRLYEMHNPAKTINETGLSFTVFTGGRPTQYRIVYVPAKEINGLAEAIAFMAKSDNSSSTLPDYDITYSTNEGLSLVMDILDKSFNKGLSITAGKLGGASIYIDNQDQIKKFIALVELGKEKLKLMK